MRIIIYIIINLFLFSSWYLLLFRKKHHLSFIDRLIGTSILSLTQIIFTEIVLGVLFKKLFAIPLFLFNTSISLMVLAVAIYTYKKEREQNILKDILHEFKDETIGFFNIIRRDGILLCVFLLFFISISYMVFLGYLFPSYTWDALWYHLPIIGYVLQSGAIQENITPSMIDLFINIFPKNIELFFIWNTIFLKSDVIIDLSQLFFTITGIFTIYSIAIKLGLREEYAIYSSLLFFFTPVVILQSTTNYIDIAVAVLFLIAINFLTPHLSLRGSQNEPKQSLEIPHFARNDKIPLLLSGLATGILGGSKGSGPIFIVVLSTMVVIQQFVRSRSLSIHSEKKPNSGFLTECLLFLVPAFLMSGYWYIKNWLLYNNPVYPIEVSFFNIELFKGLYGGIIDPVPHVLSNLSPLSRPFYVWLEKVEYYLYDSRLSGFGPVWFILLLPSIVIAIFTAVKERRFNFLFVSIILIGTFIIYPRNWYTRYVLFIIGLGALSFGLTLNYFKERQKAIKIIALLLVIYTFFTANSPCIMPQKIKEFLSLPAKEHTIARLAPFNIDLQARQDYGLWLWINNNILGGNVLAYTFEPLFLAPLWNKGFSNKVIYVKSEDFNEWMKSLEKSGATHVLIKQNSIEDKKIQEFKRLTYRLGVQKPLTERFKVVYSDENYRVLKFNP